MRLREARQRASLHKVIVIDDPADVPCSSH